MKYNYVEIGERIRKERLKNGWSQDVFIEKLSDYGAKIGRNTLSNIESGIDKAKNLKLNVLVAMSELFDCEIGYLLGEYNQKTKEEQIITNEINLSHKSIVYLKENANKSITLYNTEPYTKSNNELPQIEEEKFIYTLNYIIENYPELISTLGRILLNKKLELTPTGCRFDIVRCFFDDETMVYPDWMNSKNTISETIIRFGLQILYIHENNTLIKYQDISNDMVYNFVTQLLAKKIQFLEHENANLKTDNDLLIEKYKNQFYSI